MQKIGGNGDYAVGKRGVHVSKLKFRRMIYSSAVNGAFPDGLKAIPPTQLIQSTNPFK
jgi:hypothetical protein